MAVDTIQETTVAIALAAAHAVWAAMHDDDGLAADYIEVAICHALNHLVREFDMTVYSPSQRERIFTNLALLRERCKEKEGAMVKRWEVYSEPPF